MARIALFLARDPGPPMTGRKAVIASARAALAAEGHAVDVFVLGAPAKAVMLLNAGLSVLGLGRSLNEALFYSPFLARKARRLARGYDFAIADTIRAAPYAAALGVPWHLDLDDLFSARYEKYLEQPEALSADLVLGYFRDSAPRAARALPKPLLRALLRKEACTLKARELHWARRATSVSLVSPDEAARFARLADRRVHSLPMSVAIPARRWSAGPAAQARPAFLGGLDYKPNLDALLYYQDSIYPHLKALPEGARALGHIGNAPPEARRSFRPEAVSFEGYVDDLAPRLRSAAFFVAPIVSGTGIKTKVLEAMAIGLPVLATPQAVAGLAIEHKRHCFVCAHPAEFADGVRFLRGEGAAERLGLNARAYVEANFSAEVLQRRWRAVIGGLAAGAA